MDALREVVTASEALWRPLQRSVLQICAVSSFAAPRPWRCFCCQIGLQAEQRLRVEAGT